MTPRSAPFAPATIALRPYQMRCVKEVSRLYKEGKKAVLLQKPTGAGKTRTAAFEIYHLHSHPRSAELYRYFQMWCLLLGQEFKLIHKGHRHLYNVETNYGTFEVTANNRTQAHSLVANYGMEALSINMVG